MNTRNLISDDGHVRTYEVVSPSGEIVGSEIENLPTPEQANAGTIEKQARAALARNRALIADATVTQAEAVAAVKDHARQLNGLIRLLLQELDDTD